MSEVKTEQTITKEYNGQTYTTGETWCSPNNRSNKGVIVGFTLIDAPIIQLHTGRIDILDNPQWVKSTKTKYYIYRGYEGDLKVTMNKVSGILHEFTLEE